MFSDCKYSWSRSNTWADTIDEENYNKYKDSKKFVVQMFGLNEKLASTILFKESTGALTDSDVFLL